MFKKPKKIVCLNCGSHVKPKINTKGSFMVELLLYIVFFPVGMIYTAWRKSNVVKICPLCNSEKLIPEDSPAGKKILNENNKPSAYRAGMYYPDENFLDGVDKGDLFLFMNDTIENRLLQSELLLNGVKSKKKKHVHVEKKDFGKMIEADSISVNASDFK